MDITDMLAKLEPLMPEQVASWRRSLPQVDAQTRMLLERYIIATCDRLLGDLRNRLLLPPPPPKLAAGPINLGTVLYEKERSAFGLHPGELMQNLAIFGRSGAGKTNVVFLLLRELARLRVPFLFLDWKRTARHLLPHLTCHVRLHTPGRGLAPFHFNPLIPPPGLELHVHINHLVDTMAAAYTLGDGAKSLLQQTLAGCYAASQPLWPTFRDLHTALEQREVTSRAHGWKASAARALQSLAYADLCSQQSDQDQADLVRGFLQGSTIVELDGLNDNDRRFLIPVLLLWLYSVRLAAPDRERLALVVVLEEAHHVLYRNERRSQESLVNRILRQSRELGIGMVIVDQHPHLISSAALGNAYATVCLNLKDPADLNRAAAFCLLAEEDKHHLSLLPTGQGIVKLQDRWRRPFLAGFPLVPLQKGSMTDDALGAFLAGSRPGAARTRPDALAGARVDRGKVPDYLPQGLVDDALRLLQDVADHPDDGVKARYRRLGISVDRGTRLRQQLLDGGWLEAALVPAGMTRKLVLGLTGGARKHLGLPGDGQGREGLQHSYWKAHWARRLEAEGYRVTLEAPRKVGCMDILAERGDEWLAVEIETGQSDVVHNVKQDLMVEGVRVVVVATDEEALSKVEQQLAAAGLLVPGRVSQALCNARTCS